MSGRAVRLDLVMSIMVMDDVVVVMWRWWLLTVMEETMHAGPCFCTGRCRRRRKRWRWREGTEREREDERVRTREGKRWIMEDKMG